jgi:hypothetical protein
VYELSRVQTTSKQSYNFLGNVKVNTNLKVFDNGNNLLRVIAFVACVLLGIHETSTNNCLASMLVTATSDVDQSIIFNNILLCYMNSN